MNTKKVLVKININYLNEVCSNELLVSFITKSVEEFKNGKRFVMSFSIQDNFVYKEVKLNIKEDVWEVIRNYAKNNGTITITALINTFIKEQLNLINKD